MSDLQEASIDAPLSTTIDTAPIPSASGAGMPSLSDGKEAALPEPASLRDDIKAAFDEEVKAEPETKEVKEEPPEKVEKTDDKATETEKTDEVKAEPAKEEGAAKSEEEPEPKGEDRATRTEPPKSFLADSREVWKNVPRVVRRDIEAMTREHEAEVTRYREDGQRYEAIKPFDDIARSNGIELKDSLARVVELENLIQANPLAGLNRILLEAGPRKADGQPFSLYEVADFIVKQGPQGYQQLVTQRQQNQPQGPSEVDQLRDKVAAMEAEMKAAPIITAFAAKHDRYFELEEPIALFLSSGMVPASLSPEERLAAAYDMAVRVRPASNAQARPSTEGEETERRAGETSAAPSIKSSPGAVTEEVEDQAAGGEPIRESIRKAARSLRAA